MRRVLDNDSDMLRYLSTLGLRPGVALEVTRYVPFDMTLHVRIGEAEKTAVLGPRITREIFVELIE